VRRESYQWKQ